MAMKIIFILFFLLFCIDATQASHAAEEQMVIRAGSLPSRTANPENFSGRVRTDQNFKNVAPARHYGGTVTFEPGSRTAWHIHPLGQTLIVTSGRGLTQEWGKKPTVILPGDIVVCPPGIKHWHGASPDTAMSHIAIGEAEPGKNAQWFEKLTDEEYGKAAAEAINGAN